MELEGAWGRDRGSGSPMINPIQSDAPETETGPARACAWVGGCACLKLKTCLTTGDAATSFNSSARKLRREPAGARAKWGRLKD